MSRQMHRLVLITLIITNLYHQALAQKQEEPKPNADEARAVELLLTVADRISSLRSSSNRAIIGSTVADLLWDRDSKRSVELFEAVMKDITDNMTRLDFSNPEDMNTLSYLQQQRQRTLEIVARRDPALALVFLKATRPQFTSDKRGNNYAEQERALELSLATQVAMKDPALALKMARASLQRGVYYGQVSILTNVQQKDAAVAQLFYREIVDRLGSDDLAENNEALNVGWNLLSAFQPPVANEETFRQLIDTLARRVLDINPADSARVQLSQNLYHQLRWPLQLMEKHSPARAQSLREWSKMVERTFDANTRMYAELNELSQEGTVDDILALTSRYPEEMHLAINQHAVWKAVNGGELERARQLAKEKISDPIQRQQLLDQIENNLAWKSTNDSQVAEARRHLSNIRQPEQRVQMMMQLAANLAGKGDKEAALDLLIEARSYLASVPQSSQKLNAQLQLIRSYCGLAPDEAESMLQPFIAHLNQLVAAAVVLDGLDSRYLQDGEWMVQNYFSVNGLVNNLDQALGQLAATKKHFSTAETLANQLERPEIRLYAQLSIAQSVLGNVAPNGALISRPNIIQLSNTRRLTNLQVLH